MACFNAVKDSHTTGKTYELGGPNIYTHKEILEIMSNAVEYPIKFIKLNETIINLLANYSPSLYCNLM